MVESDPELLTFVFTFHVVDRIVLADGDLDATEIAWIRDLFPRESLYDRGLIDDDNALTERYAELLDEALEHLPEHLNEDARAALVQTFFDSALADGAYDEREAEMIRYACSLLGIPPERIHDALPDVTLEDDG